VRLTYVCTTRLTGLPSTYFIDRNKLIYVWTCLWRLFSIFSRVAFYSLSSLFLFYFTQKRDGNFTPLYIFGLCVLVLSGLSRFSTRDMRGGRYAFDVARHIA